MQSNKVVASKNLPSKLPVATTIAVSLLLDRLHAPPMAWGVWVALAAMVWLGSTWAIFNSTYVDIFDK